MRRGGRIAALIKLRPGLQSSDKTSPFWGSWILFALSAAISRNGNSCILNDNTNLRLGWPSSTPLFLRGPEVPDHSLSLSLSPSARIADAYREGISAYLVCLSYGFYGEGVRRRRGEGFRAYLSRRQCNFPIPIPLVGRPGITSTCSFPFRCSYDMIAFQRIERGRKDHLLRHVLLQRK